MVRPVSVSVAAAALLVCASAAAQAPPAPAPPAPAPAAAAPGTAAAPAKIEVVPDPVRLPVAEVPYAHPLYRALDAPARLTDRPPLSDFTARATLFTSVRLDENGKVTEGQAVQPPLAALSETVNALIPKWRFAPAKRGGAPVATWATYGIELEVTLEKGAFSGFALLPIAKDDPTPVVGKEWIGDSWITRYPREISPKDPSAFSIEDVDVLPIPEKARWSFSSVRAHARITALVEVSSVGAVRRVVPTGSFEPILLAWVRQNAAAWRLSPATAGGKPVDSWMRLDTTLEYTIDDAREKGKRSVKKNLRGVPPS